MIPAGQRPTGWPDIINWSDFLAALRLCHDPSRPAPDGLSFGQIQLVRRAPPKIRTQEFQASSHFLVVALVDIMHLMRNS
jgi:hypothetical protein